MTHPRLTRSAAACMAVLLMALACAGCGRRGRLENPPDDTEATAEPAPGATAQPARHKKAPPTPVPKSFILDPLI